MKGVVALVLAVVFACSVATALPYLVPPYQYEEFCEHQLVSGTGVMKIEVSIVDKHLALDYYQFMTNEDQPPAEIEMDSLHMYSQHEFNRTLPCDSGDVTTILNFYEDTKMAFDGEVPGAAISTLTGWKTLESKGFYGGMDASITEYYGVQQLEKDQKAFFSSTNNSMCPVPDGTRQRFDNERNIAHSIGLDTKNSFNGTWGTRANMHKIFYKDITANEEFTGVFEVAKEIKFHERADGCVPVGNPCCIIDC